MKNFWGSPKNPILGGGWGRGSGKTNVEGGAWQERGNIFSTNKFIENVHSVDLIVTTKHF